MHFYIRWVDGLSKALGVLAAWALMGACTISAGNALLRYAFNLGSNAWLEAQWSVWT
jgi:TRAP-type mannitol/chloroaromatic compound transport system permease small subunit